MDIYQRQKAIRKFMKTETRVLEDVISEEINNRLRKYGIKYISNKEEDMKELVNELKKRNINIDIVECYHNKMYRCEFVGISDNYMNVVIEDNRYLQCGKEIRI